MNWDLAINPNSSSHDYTYKTLLLPKQVNDKVKYMNGYYNAPWHRTYDNDFYPADDDIDEFTIGWPNGDEPFVCSTYSRDLWHTYTGNWIELSGKHWPRDSRSST